MDAIQINTSNSPHNVENAVNKMTMCRVCLLENMVMRDLFLENDVASLSNKAMSFANVKMHPNDGLPARVCCVCADKLESAYEFKLQVEQADGVLRERFDSLRVKEELFFNEVEVHLAAESQKDMSDIQIDTQYHAADNENYHQEVDTEKNLLKDELELLPVDKLEEQSTQPFPKDEGEIDQLTLKDAEEITDEQLTMDKSVVESMHVEESTYLTQNDNILSNEELSCSKEQVISQQDVEQCVNSILRTLPRSNVNSEHDLSKENSEIQLEQPEESTVLEEAQIETRRSKRKTTNQVFTDRDSDEENYFENLNLSSRLKQFQADKADKIFFACYLCDEQFLSKVVLKEHMHSHEEVRKALALTKTSDKSQKIMQSPLKMPPSGKRANKCPYCGKEYLYVISFNKHLKQHEKERDETKDESMPLEVSFREDEHSLDFDDTSRYSDFEYDRGKDDEDSTNENGEENNEEIESDKIHESGKFSCDKCFEEFHSKHRLLKHSITHINLKCSVCKEEFDTLEKLRNHRTKHVIEGVLSEQDLEEDDKHLIEKDIMEYENVENVENIENTYNTQEKMDWSQIKYFKCPHCPMKYTHKKALARHVETHTGTKYNCKLCNQDFNKKDHYLRHMEQHGKIKTYKCTQCNKTFGNELTLRNHLIATNHKTFIHGQEYDPNKRIKRVAARAAQRIIDKIKTEDNVEDFNDDNVDDSVDFDINHSRKRDSLPKKYYYKKELECATCHKRCCSKLSLTRHMEQHVKDEKMEKVEKAKKESRLINSNEVGDGDDDDDDNSDFESGLDWPMDSHECTTCKKRYSTKKSLLRHQLLHEEPNFECDICNVKFYRKDKLKAHYDKCSEKNPDQVRKCNICGDSFENNEMLREHRAKHVTEGILTEEDLRDIEPRPEEKKPGEKIVRKRRTDIVGLECTECNKQYTSRKGLLRHIQVHEGKKYLCDICPKKFYRREHLKIHVAKHNMIKPYKCTRCTKRFIKEEQLTNHLSKHDRNFKKNKDTDTSKRFLCEVCSKSFTQSTTLIAHLRAHNGIKPYVCEVCSRPFTTNAYLKMHMRTHTQERPYICQYCSRAFARADTLANHLTSHTGEAKYHCKYCPKNFRRLKSLKEHVFIHTGQRPYACPTCDRRFNNNGSRYAHSKRCKQNLLQNQNRTQNLAQVVQNTNQQQPQQRVHQALAPTQVVKTQNIKTITIARQTDSVTAPHVLQHQEILMPLILPLTVTLTDVGEEVILPEGTKIFTTS